MTRIIAGYEKDLRLKTFLSEIISSMAHIMSGKVHFVNN